MLSRTTKKRQSFCTKPLFSSFCRRFRRFVVVFFLFISFCRLSRLLSLRNDCFFVVFCLFLTLFFSKEFVVFCSFFRLLIALELVFLYSLTPK